VLYADVGWLSSTSAICERQELPVHSTSTVQGRVDMMFPYVGESVVGTQAGELDTHGNASGARIVKITRGSSIIHFA
jgi:hypothetical protein